MKLSFKKLFYRIFSYFIIRTGAIEKIYLTFDDGPHSPNTLKVLAELKKTNTKATFFMVGEQVEANADIVKQVVADGHSIGYHSNNHISLKEMTFGELKNDLLIFDGIRKKFNISTKIYRPPYGDLTLLSFLWLAFTGWKIVMWSVDSRDSFDSVEKIIENVSPNNICGGDIVLFHDDYDLVVDILSDVVTRLKSHGYSFDVL